jgi:hypothetical protein
MRVGTEWANGAPGARLTREAGTARARFAYSKVTPPVHDHPTPAFFQCRCLDWLQFGYTFANVQIGV